MKKHRHAFTDEGKYVWYCKVDGCNYLKDKKTKKVYKFFQKQNCGHLNNDLSMCQDTHLYASSIYCQTHFADLNASSKASKIQDNRLDRLRKTIYQIQTGVDFGILPSKIDKIRGKEF